MPKRAAIIFAALLILILAPALSAANVSSARPAADYKLEKAAGGPPEGISAAIRETLSPEGWRVTGPDGPMCEIWLRATIPAKAQASQRLGVVFGELEEGALVGAIRFLAPEGDYRRVRVKPGVYTMRYMLNPADGNHMGVAPQRDFLLLSPAASDTNVATLPTDELQDLSRKASGTTHPTVWSLQAGKAGEGPSLSHNEDEDQWVLNFTVKLQPEGGTTTSKGMGLVIVGHAPEA